MKHVKKSVLLWYAPHEMYALVIDVATYPEFLPWCERAEVLARDEQGLTARRHLAFSGIRQTFTTRNIHVPDAWCTSSWSTARSRCSTASGGSCRCVRGGRARRRAACKIEFELRYGFGNASLEAVSARCSTASPTPSSTPSSSAPSRSTAALRRRRDAARRGRLQPARRRGVSRCARRAAGTAHGARCAARQRPAASATRQLDARRAARSASGAARALGRVLRDGDRVEIYRPLHVDPKEARRLRARQPAQAQAAALSRDYLQSVAITPGRACVSSARCLSSRISRSPLSLVRAMRMPLSSVRTGPARAAAVVGLRGGDAVFLGLVLGRLRRPRPSCASLRARGSPPCAAAPPSAAPRPRAEAPPRRCAGRRRPRVDAAPRSAGARMSFSGVRAAAAGR